MSDRYDSLACEAAAHERANAAEAENERLRGLLARSEETVKSVHEFSHAKTDEIKRLKGLLAEAEEQRKSLGAVISALMSKREHFAKCKMLGMTDGEALAAILPDQDQVQRALKGASL